MTSDPYVLWAYVSEFSESVDDNTISFFNDDGDKAVIMRNTGLRLPIYTRVKITVEIIGNLTE